MSRERFATQVDESVLRRARAAVEALQRLHGPRYITLSQLTTDALDEHVRALEAEHNGGEPWNGTGPLLAGRRVDPS